MLTFEEARAAILAGAERLGTERVALANAIAVSSAARSVILLGDPQQLDQVVQGSHPPGAERSALAVRLSRTGMVRADRCRDQQRRGW